MGEPGVARRTSEHFASEFGSGLTVRAFLERAGRPRLGQRPAARPRRPWCRASCPLRRRLDPAPRPPDRPVRLRPDALGALSFPRRGGGGGRGGSRGGSAEGTLASPGDDQPFVAATTIQTGRRRRMSRQAISTGGAPAAIGPYSQAIRSGDMVFCSGQLGLDPATGELVDGVEAQAERALRNLASVLDAAGSRLRRRRQDDVLPRRHRRLRRGERGLRPAHAGPAAGPLDRPGRGTAERRPGRDRGHRPTRPRSTRPRGPRPDGRRSSERRSSRRTSPVRRRSRAVVEGLTEDELDARPADGGWTPREVVHHTADSEMTSAIRLRRLIAEDDPLIVAYDGDEFARRLHYADRPIEPRSTRSAPPGRRPPRSSAA